MSSNYRMPFSGSMTQTKTLTKIQDLYLTLMVFAEDDLLRQNGTTLIVKLLML